MYGNMFNSVFVLFLVTFNLMLISICCITYLFKTVLQGAKKILERELAMEEMREKLETSEKQTKTS